LKSPLADRHARSRTLFIGDLLKADVKGAQRAGMHTIWSRAKKLVAAGDRNPPKRCMPDLGSQLTHLPEALEHFGWRPARQRQHAQIVNHAIGPRPLKSAGFIFGAAGFVGGNGLAFFVEGFGEGVVEVLRPAMKASAFLMAPAVLVCR